MPPSYQTVPLAVPPKTLAIPPEEPAPTSVPTMKKLVVAAMVGTALVGGYSYGSSTNPAMINNVNGFAAGVSYSGTYCTASDPHHPDDATLYSAPGVVPADHESWFFGPLKGDPATVCLEVCLTPSQAEDFARKVLPGMAADNIKLHPAGCQTLGYTAYESESTYVQLHPKLLVGPETEHASGSAFVFWIPIFKKQKPFVCLAKDNDDGVYDSNCAQCAAGYKYWPCCLGLSSHCEGAACKYSDSSYC